MKQFLLSSTGSGEVSLTLKGIAVLLLPIAIQIANAHGIAITQDNVMQAMANITAIVAQGAICIGLARKFYAWAKLLVTPVQKPPVA